MIIKWELCLIIFNGAILITLDNWIMLNCFFSQGTDEDTERLIKWPSQNEDQFTGRRNAAQKGFE